MDQNLIKQLKALKNTDDRLAADRLWVAENKKALVARIAAEKKEAPAMADRISRGLNILVPSRMRMVLRPAMTMVLVVVISAAGWAASVSASYKSLPGDLLYNVKLATEKTQLVMVSLVGDEEKETQLLSNAARTRAYEAKALVAQKKFAHVDETLKKSVETLAEANKKVKEVKEKKPEQAIASAGTVSKASGEIKKTFDEVLDDISNDGATNEETTKLAGSIVTAKKDATAQGIEAVESIVESLDEVADSDEEKQEVEKLVLETIEQVGDDTDGEVDEVSAEEILEDVVESTNATGTIETASSSVPLADIIEEVADEAAAAEENSREVAEELEEATNVAKEELEQAKQLVEEGQLSEALSKAKGVNEINANIEQTAMETNQQSEADRVVEEAVAERVATEEAEQEENAKDRSASTTP